MRWREVQTNSWKLAVQKGPWQTPCKNSQPTWLCLGDLKAFFTGSANPVSAALCQKCHTHITESNERQICWRGRITLRIDRKPVLRSQVCSAVGAKMEVFLEAGIWFWMGGIIQVGGDLFGRAWGGGVSKLRGITGRTWRVRVCENVKKKGGCVAGGTLGRLV